MSIRNKKLRSIPPPSKKSKVGVIHIRIGGIGGNAGDSSKTPAKDSWKPRGVPPKEIKKGAIGEPPEYPRRPIVECFLEEKGKSFRIIIECPHHTKEEISVSMEGDVVRIESALEEKKYNFFIEIVAPFIPTTVKKNYNNFIFEILLKR
ncbi:MAG: Hsp20/alpha crystallin family protein [Patescibacteria group bacterium]